MSKAIVIGAGLAGSEAAWQLAKRGIEVELFEMRPAKTTKAHKTAMFAELVCSNSFRGAELSSAVGLLKEELKLLDSLIMQAAMRCKVPAGGALAVDRELFGQYVTQKLTHHSLIKVVEKELIEIPESSTDAPVIVATGPLTSRPLAAAIVQLTGNQNLAFFDAISPIIYAESLDMQKLFRASRYGKGGGDDYLNIPLSKEQYEQFIQAVSEAEKYGGNEEVESDMVEELRPFEGCMPIEDMIERGPETLRYGPLKPVGLQHPESGEEFHAVVQLRQDDRAGHLWSMVGFQTRMRRPEQDKIFRTLPGLEKAEFVRYGSVHRNTFLESPKCLNSTLEFRERKGLFFAGQVTGTEGYVESTAGGLVAGINAARGIAGREGLTFPQSTAIGGLMNYISDPERKNFQPMNVSFGLIPTYLNTPKRVKGRRLPRRERRILASEKALADMKDFIRSSDIE